MTTDLTDQFQKAAQVPERWTTAGVERALAVVVAAHPGARVDWEPGDEEWARVIAPASDEIVALICARIPFAFIRGDAPLHNDPEYLSWVAISASSDPAFRIDPAVLDRVFGRPVSRNLDYDAVSAEDIWWATV